MIEWTPERISGLALEDLEVLRQNAERLGAKGVADLCKTDEARRAQQRGAKSRGRHDGEVVVGFHFVCRPRETGVTRNQDGTFWTGTWVVAERHAQAAGENGAYVALHLERSKPSYLQGNIEDWRLAERYPKELDREVGFEIGVDFLCRSTHAPYDWVGDGTGEKGYKWRSRN